ncbi:MAG TPA: hypothetical protein VF331_09115 [Polyangiales bacterium]
MKPRHQLARPLCHPVFVVALVTLALNDHLLKHAHVLPGWLTGKASDFAGLIVAPIVAAELCVGRLRWLRLWAAGLVVLGFMACKLSPASAGAFDLWMGRVGLPSRLVADPSDLLALCVLPVTLRLLHVSVGAPRRLWWRERIVLACAAGLCVATTAPPRYAFGPFLVNHSGAAITLQLRWLPASTACSAAPEQLRAWLRVHASAPVHSVVLQPAQVADIAWEPHAATDGIVGRCPGWYSELSDPFAHAVDAAALLDAGRADAAVAQDSNAGSDPAESCIAVELCGSAVAHVIVRAPRGWVVDDHLSACRQPLPVYEDPGDGAIVLTHGDGRAQVRGHKKIEVIALE